MGNEFKEPSKEGTTSINLKVSVLCLKIFSDTAVDNLLSFDEYTKELIKNRSTMIKVFDKVLKSELSQAWVRENELKDQVENLSKQVANHAKNN